MILHHKHKRLAGGLALLGGAFTLILLTGAESTSAAEPPPPDERHADEGPDRPRDPRIGPDDRRGGPRDQRPRDRFRRRREGRREGGIGPDDELPPEMVEKMMEVLRERLPEAYARLDKIRDRNPQEFPAKIRRLVPFFKEYMMLNDERPDLATRWVEDFKNEQRLTALSRQFRDAAQDPAKQSEIAAEIESIVRRQTAFHQERMSFRLDQFEKRIKEQQEMLERQRARVEEEKSQAEDHVAKRVEEIKKGQVRRPIDRPGPGGPGRFGDGPPGGPRGQRREPRPDHDGAGSPPGSSPDEPPPDYESEEE